MKNKFILGLGLLLSLPTVSFAAQRRNDRIESFQDILAAILATIEIALIPIIIGLAVVFFLIGVLKFIRAAGDPKARQEGQQFMLWGIIGLAVMVSVWGLVNIVSGTFGIKPMLPTADPIESGQINN